MELLDCMRWAGPLLLGMTSPQGLEEDDWWTFQDPCPTAWGNSGRKGIHPMPALTPRASQKYNS